VNLRPTSEIYNMAWAGPSSEKPVWCGQTGKGGPTAQGVSCTTADPAAGGPEVALLQVGEKQPEAFKSQSGTQLQPHPANGEGQTVTDGAPLGAILMPVSYQKFTSQADLGKYLTGQYHIRTPNELSSCETCHR
jgi:hypothetical protein